MVGDVAHIFGPTVIVTSEDLIECYILNMETLDRQWKGSHLNMKVKVRHLNLWILAVIWY